MSQDSAFIVLATNNRIVSTSSCNLRYACIMSRFTDVDLDKKELTRIGDYRNHPLLSLEQALKPILPRIDQLDRSIELAKQCCCYPSKHDLTCDESAAIYLYTMERDGHSFYRFLSQTLRTENRLEIEPWFAYLKLFDTALNKLPTLKQVIWRGVPGNMSNNYKKNQIITWWSISSCSFSVDVIKNMLGTDATLFKIEAMNGKDVSDYTIFPDETEVLLRSGTRLRVESNVSNHTAGPHVIHLVEVNDNNDEQLQSALVTIDMTQKPSDGGASGTKVTNDSRPSSRMELASVRNDRVNANNDRRVRAAHPNGNDDAHRRGGFAVNAYDTGAYYYDLNASDAVQSYFVALENHLFVVLASLMLLNGNLLFEVSNIVE